MTRGLGVVDDRHVVGDVPAARRTLSDGRQFDIVKVFRRLEDLVERLRNLGWLMNMERLEDVFMFGVAHGAGA
jgi:hypothetical protein